MILSEYIDELQERGELTFRLPEAMEAAGLSRAAFYNAASRLKKSGRLIRPRQGFYVIVRLEDRAAGGPPPIHYIHQLMDYLGLEYYVGLISAAQMYGAAHQAPQALQVVTVSRLRPVREGRAEVRFILDRDAGRTPCTLQKTPAGYVRVSTPEGTAVDLVRYARRAGGMGNAAGILAELAGSGRLDPEKLRQAAAGRGELSAGQRLGYLLERLGFSRLASPLAGWVEDRRAGWIPLIAAAPIGGAAYVRRWRVQVNGEIELDSALQGSK